MGQVQTGNNHISEESLRLWYQALLSRFSTITAGNNSIDNKSGIILAAAVAVLTFGADAVQKDPSILGFVGLLGMLVAIIVAITNIHVGNAWSEVNSTTEREEYYAKTDAEFTWQLISDLEYSISKTEEINRKKSKAYYRVIYLFLLSGITLVISNFIIITITS